jgi:hypothetical protein
VHCVVLRQLMLVPALAPNWTDVLPAAVLKLKPLMVTGVPPVTGPLLGLTPVMVGVVPRAWQALVPVSVNVPSTGTNCQS